MEYIIALLTAIIGGIIGTYCGARFLNKREEDKMEMVRAIGIKALEVLKKYSKQSYRNAENDFNTSLSLVEKRTVLVALHKLGIPIGTPSNEPFNIKTVCFVNTPIEEDVINDIILQIQKGFCDHLFYIDPDTHFTTNYALYTLRSAAKKYVNEVLAKSTLDIQQNFMTSPKNWESHFSLGELKPIMVFKEQVNISLNFDERGNPKTENIKSLLREIDLGLWDFYLTWNYEVYQNVMKQCKMGDILSSWSMNQQAIHATVQTAPASDK